MTRKFVFRSLLLASAGWGLPAVAQEAPVTTAAASEGDEIIVTARRREESLTDVPIAVTALSGAQLERTGAIDLTDIAQAAPNTTLEPSRGTNSTLTAFIRGIGQQDPVSGFEQGVGIYLDDVYLNRPQGAVLDIYDVERIEVLRGPQGTLYGRNTIGGAVKYVTRALPDDFSLKARATYGSYDQADGVLSVSAPLSDMIRVGGALARLSRGGFGRNITTGQENYNKDIWAGRGTVEVGGNGQPVLVRISGDYTHDKSLARGGYRLIPGRLSGAPVLGNRYDTAGGLTTPVQDVKAYGFAINATAELSDTLTLRSISAWRKDKSTTPIDFDALPSADLDVPGIYRNEQISQEVQLLYKGNGINALLGGYYLEASALTQFDVRLFTTFAGLTAFTNANVDTKTSAIFADVSFDLTDQISLSLGGRYTWDKRSAQILRQNYLGGGSPVFGGLGVPFGAAQTNFNGARDFNKFTPRASISFKPDRDNTVYASFSQGFKGGGFDPRGVGLNAPVQTPEGITSFLSFRPETVDSYEVGYKGTLADRRVTVALAAFRMDYRDVQIPGSVGCVVNGLPTFCGLVTNAGKARFQGVELETSTRLAEDLLSGGDRLTFSGSVGYIDAKYRQYITQIPGVGPVDVAAFRRVQNTPEWTASATLAYRTGLMDGRLDLSTTVSAKSYTYQFEIPNPYLDQPGYALWDASVVYSAPGDRFSIGVHGKNLLDKAYKTSGYTFLAANPTTGALAGSFPNFTPTLGREGTLTTFWGNPRQIFVTAAVKF